MLSVQLSGIRYTEGAATIPSIHLQDFSLPQTGLLLREGGAAPLPQVFPALGDMAQRWACRMMVWYLRHHEAVWTLLHPPPSLPAVCEHPTSQHPLQSLFLIMAIVVCVTWSLAVVLICVFLRTSDADSFLMSFAHCVPGLVSG